MLKLPSISIRLRQLKNSFVPINRLPPEILALIPTFRESEEDLMSATAVCKYWRRTLVSAPKLWNNIVCGRDTVINPRMHMYFERSGSVPIVVRIHSNASRLLSSHTERVSGLTMFIDHPSDIDEIAQYLSKPAPLLETITLRVAHWGRRCLILPPEFFKGFISSARTLILHGTILFPGPCKLSRLTKFTLETDLTDATSANLLDALEQMPSLQIFNASLRSRSSRGQAPGNRVVTLRRLEEISITMLMDDNSFAPAAGQILPSLRLPSARKVLLMSIGASDIPLTPILPLSFEDRLPSLSVLPKASVVLDKGLNVSGFFGPGGSELKLLTSSDAPYAFVQSTFGGLPFDSVHTLQVSFRSSTVDRVFFVNLLRHTKGLKRLQLKQNTMGPLTSWIGLDDQAGTCPALDTLIVIDDKTQGCVEVLKQIRECAGVPIGKVKVRDD